MRTYHDCCFDTVPVNGDASTCSTTILMVNIKQNIKKVFSGVTVFPILMTFHVFSDNSFQKLIKFLRHPINSFIETINMIDPPKPRNEITNTNIP